MLCCASAGCGSASPKREYAEVTGVVTYHDEPVAAGTISFQPPSGALVTAPLEDGRFVLQGVVGKNRVIIISRDSLPEVDPDEPLPATPPALPKSYIPEKYSFPNSPLEFQVEPGSNQAEFILNDDDVLIPGMP